MAKGLYLGVDSKARKMKKAYIGIDGKARKIKKVYVGVNGKARLAYTAAKLDVTWITTWECDDYKNDNGKRRYKTKDIVIFTLDVEPSNATVTIKLNQDDVSGIYSYNNIYVTSLNSNNTFTFVYPWDTDDFDSYAPKGTAILTITSSEGLKKTLEITLGATLIAGNSTYGITGICCA